MQHMYKDALFVSLLLEVIGFLLDSMLYFASFRACVCLKIKKGVGRRLILGGQYYTENI